MSRLSRLINFHEVTFITPAYTAEHTKRLTKVIHHFRKLTDSNAVPLSDAALFLVREIFEDESIGSPYQRNRVE